MTEKEIRKAWRRMASKLESRGMGYKNSLTAAEAKSGEGVIRIAFIVPYDKRLKNIKKQIRQASEEDKPHLLLKKKELEGLLKARGTAEAQLMRASTQVGMIVTDKAFKEFLAATGATYERDDDELEYGRLVNLKVYFSATPDPQKNKQDVEP